MELVMMILKRVRCGGMAERGSGVRLAIENWQRDVHGLFVKWWIAGMELMV
jgi:hypothetical protein